MSPERHKARPEPDGVPPANDQTEWFRQVLPPGRRASEVEIRCRALPTIGRVGLVELHPLQLQDLYARLMMPKAAGGPEDQPLVLVDPEVRCLGLTATRRRIARRVAPGLSRP